MAKKASLNLNLTDARDQCMEYLISALSSPIYQGIYSIYMDAIKSGDSIKGFQMRLRKIKEWSQGTIEDEFARIAALTKGAKYLEDLITAIFVSNAKILSSAAGGGRVEISVPSPIKFIHKCYLEVARRFYEDPMTFEGSVRTTVGNADAAHKRQKYTKAVLCIISDGIRYAVNLLTPADEILGHVNEIFEPEPESEQKGGSHQNEPDNDNDDDYSDSDSEIDQPFNEIAVPEIETVDVKNDLNVGSKAVGPEEKMALMDNVFEQQPIFSTEPEKDSDVPVRHDGETKRITVSGGNGGRQLFKDAADHF